MAVVTELPAGAFSAQRLVAEAPRYGHSVVGRFSGADELAVRLAALSPQAVMAAADPQYLNARLVSACDASGVRLVVVASSPEQQRHARSLGVVDALLGDPAWATLIPHATPAAPATPSASGPAETDAVAAHPRPARRG